MPLSRRRILSPLRLPFRHGPEVPDSTGDIDVLQAIKTENWERLGGLLAVRDPVLGAIISAWRSLTPRQRDALAALAVP
jgi:hypothetical protein